MKSNRDRYKPKDHKAYEFNKKIIDVEKIYNPSRKMIDLSDSGVKNQNKKGSILFSEQFNQEQLDIDINPYRNMTSNHGTRSQIFDTNLINPHEKQEDSSLHLYSSSDGGKGFVRNSGRIKDTGRLLKHQNPDSAVDRSHRSISYLEKARLRDGRKLRSPGVLYKKYHNTKQKIKSTGRLSQRHSGYEKIDSDNQKNSSPNNKQSNRPNTSIKTSFDTSKLNDIGKSKRKILEKFGLSKVVYSKIDFTNSEDNDEPKYDSRGLDSSEKQLSANKNLKDYESSATEEEKYHSRPIKDRYSTKNEEATEQKQDIINPYAKMVGLEGNEEDETLKYRQSIINMQDDEPQEMDFTKRQNLTGLFKGLVDNLIDDQPTDRKHNKSDEVNLHHDFDQIDENTNNLEENADDLVLHQDQNVPSCEDQEQQNEQRPFEENKPDADNQVDIVNHEESPAATKDNAIITFEEEAKVIARTDTKGPIISDEFAKRQSSIHEEFVHGMTSPSKKPNSILDMVDNIEEQFDNIDDDFDEGSPDNVKKQEFKLQHMQSDQVYLAPDGGNKSIVDHPEQVNMPGKPRDDHQLDDELVYDQLNDEEELKQPINDQNEEEYNDEFYDSKRKPIMDSPHDKHYGDVQKIDDIKEPYNKKRSPHHSRKELYTVDSILKRRNDSEEFDEGNKLTTKIHQEQAEKIRGETSLDPIGDFEESKRTSRRSAADVDNTRNNDSMKQDSHIKQSKDSINPESMITQKYVQSDVSNPENNFEKESDSNINPENQINPNNQQDISQTTDLYKPRYKSPDEIMGEKIEQRHKNRLEKLKQDLDFSQREMHKKYGKQPAQKDPIDEIDIKRINDKSNQQSFKDQRKLLKNEIKQLDDELQRESHSLKHMQDISPKDIDSINLLNEQVEPIPEVEEVKQQRLDDYRQSDPKILSFDENINTKNADKRPKYKNMIPDTISKDRFDFINDDKFDSKIDPDSYLRIQDDEDTPRGIIEDESPLYFNNRGQKYGPDYYHIANNRDNFSIEKDQDAIANENSTDPEIKAIEDKYSSNKNQDNIIHQHQPFSQDEYKGPLSRYLDRSKMHKINSHPSNFTSSGLVSPKELESSFVNDIQDIPEEDLKSQKDQIIDVHPNPISDDGKPVGHHAKSEYGDAKDIEYYNSSNKTNEANKGSKYGKQDQLGFDELDQIQPQIEPIYPKRPQKDNMDFSHFDASFGKKGGFKYQIQDPEYDSVNVFNPNLENKRHNIALINDEDKNKKKHKFRNQKPVKTTKKAKYNEANTGKFGDDPIHYDQFEDEVNRNVKNKKKTKEKKDKPTRYQHQNLDRYKKRLKKHLSRQNELDDRNTQILNKAGDKNIESMNYMDYNNDTYEEDKNQSFNENLLDFKESRIQVNDNTLENQYYNKEDADSNSLHEDINKMVDRMQYNSQKDTNYYEHDPNSISDSDYFNKNPTGRFGNGSFPDSKYGNLHDQYNRVHQEVIDKLTGPKS